MSSTRSPAEIDPTGRKTGSRGSLGDPYPDARVAVNAYTSLGQPIGVHAAVGPALGVAGGVDVALLPESVAPEHGPAVGVGADVEPAAAGRHAAARLRRAPVDARLAIGVVGHHELAVVPDVAWEEAELPVHVAADAGRRARQAVRVHRVGIDEDDLRREGRPGHQVS